MTERRFVLDTNVVLDVLHFSDPSVHPLAQAIRAGRVRCGATGSNFDEWRRVLGYPGFALDVARQAVLVEAYRAVCDFFPERTMAGLPRCADVDDQKFLDLAAALRVPLVSRDRAVLKLRRRCAARFPILTPLEAAGWLAT